MRLLIIEDEVKTATYLQMGLVEHGFIADIATNGKDGLFYISNFVYNLIVLDIMLPYVDGWTIINTLRKENKSLPVLVLTACDAVEDRVKGLDLGADDYLIKPFSFSELLARIRSMLRRGQVCQQPLILQCADLEVNLREHRATRAGQKLNLTAKEFTLLTLLIKHQGEYLSRSIITDQVWDINFSSDTNIVDVMIRRLRQKVDGPFMTKLIHTAHGVGYVLEQR